MTKKKFKVKNQQTPIPPVDGLTLNIVEQNIEKLRELFPDAFAEASDEHGPRWKVDIDSLREILGEYVEDKPERYSFNWNGKARARRIAQTPSTGTLRPCPEESVNWDTTQNIFIEGDNLEVLKLLQKSYHKKVKMIYIDPPYNTGKEFIYPDKFADNLGTYLKYTGQVDEEGLKLSANAETSGRYHTNWLNMMLPRLKLARNLLRDDGVIFISIDDVEIANLRKLCDEIFDEENRLSDLVWDLGSGTAAGHFTRAHEYILVLAKNKNTLTNFKYNGTAEIISERAVKKISRGNPASRISFPAGIEFEGDNAIFSGTFGRSEKITVIDGPMVFEKGRLASSVTIEAGWAMRNQILSWLEGKETYDTKGQRVSRFYFSKKGVLQYEKERGFINPPSVLRQIASTKRGSEDIVSLFGGKVLDFPKPVALLQYLVQLICDSEDIILDFFSGSCTSAESVLLHNTETEASVKFVCVQLPEPCDQSSDTGKTALEYGFATIAEIGKERIRRVIKKIEGEQAEKVKEAKGRLDGMGEEVQDLDLGFKVFKLDASNIKPWDADFDNLEAELFNAVENIKPDRSEADVLYELLLKYGLDLAVPIEERKIESKTVYIIGAGALVVCLADKISLKVVEGIAALKDELKPEVMRVVFKDAGFADDVVKTNTVQILRQAGIDDVKSL